MTDKTRREQIEEAANDFWETGEDRGMDAFIRGAEWADANPQDLIYLDFMQVREYMKKLIDDLRDDHKIMKEALEFYTEFSDMKVKALWPVTNPKDEQSAVIATEVLKLFGKPLSEKAKEALEKLRVK